MSTYKKYKLRVEFQKDADLIFSAINAFVDEWTVVPICCFDGVKPNSIRHAWMDNEVIFTVSDDLTLPMMRWVLTKLVDLHVAAETIELFENYTGERVHYDDVVTEEPSPAVWHVLQYSLEHAAEFWEGRSVELREAAIEFAVPESKRTDKRLRSKDKHVDACLKRIFDENRPDKDNLA